jgi:hypothetical protein
MLTGVQDYLSQGLQEKKYEATGLQVVTPTGVQEAQSTTEDPTTEDPTTDATTKDTLEDLWKTENSNIDDLLRENTQLLKEATEETSSSNPAAPTKLLQFLVKDADEGMVAERAASIKSLAGLSAWPASVPASASQAHEAGTPGVTSTYHDRNVHTWSSGTKHGFLVDTHVVLSADLETFTRERASIIKDAAEHFGVEPENIKMHPAEYFGDVTAEEVVLDIEMYLEICWANNWY